MGNCFKTHCETYYYKYTLLIFICSCFCALFLSFFSSLIDLSFRYGKELFKNKKMCFYRYFFFPSVSNAIYYPIILKFEV